MSPQKPLIAESYKIPYVLAYLEQPDMELQSIGVSSSASWSDSSNATTNTTQADPLRYASLKGYRITSKTPLLTMIWERKCGF
jgi:hypothetical protein